MIERFDIMLINQKLASNYCYSYLFQYKDLLGFMFGNDEIQNGFILFSYYNSTDPKQIYSLKRDGINYNVKLNSHLNLQTNIFNYKIIGVKLLSVPSTQTGLFLISNNTNNIINENEIIDVYTTISLYFAYNSIIKTGNFIFKFAGVIEEPTFDVVENNADDIFWFPDDNEELIEQYNNRRKKNIIGRAALIQINILNDTKVFCDSQYDNSCFKKDKNCLTCGNGKFYEVENDNEITQYNLGINYFFDEKSGVYIKCHKKCKTCSKRYTSIYMNCDSCEENFYIRDTNCLQISKCEYNYYYDEESNLHCINKTSHCPDLKPFENKESLECIEQCNLDEFKTKCNPTNNQLSINKTYNLIFDNINNLNLNKLLFSTKAKFTVQGHNVSFFITTTDIEKNELDNNVNSSTIFLNNCEKIIRDIYSIPDDYGIPILKIETTDNHSDFMNVNYELLNPFNLSEKLNLDICENETIEIRLPVTLKQYKSDLINKVKEYGYNIFDPNDPFYNDICSVFAYNDSDFSLAERKTLLDLSDENLCMKGCNYVNMDINTLRSICDCKISNNTKEDNKEQNIEEINSDSNSGNLIDSIKFESTSNIRIVKCFKAIFNKKLFTNNYGFYLMLMTNFFILVLLLLYPISFVETKLAQFCVSVLTQIKEIYKFRKQQKDKNQINKIK